MTSTAFDRVLFFALPCFWALLLGACQTGSTPMADQAATLQAPSPEPASAPTAPTSHTSESLPASAPASLPQIEIVEKLIPFDKERERLTLEYIREHYDPAAQDITIIPRMIIIHWTGGSSAQGTIATFSASRIESGRKEVARGGEVNVSSQFLIDRDGTIYQLMPETIMARHCIGLNRVAIGVENVGGGKDYPLTEAQLASNAALVRYLKAKYPDITHLIGHLEYRDMEGHPYFQELVPGYRNRKPDPGPEFMEKLRAEVADLGLEGPPTPKK